LRGRRSSLSVFKTYFGSTTTILCSYSEERIERSHIAVRCALLKTQPVSKLVLFIAAWEKVTLARLDIEHVKPPTTTIRLIASTSDDPIIMAT